MFKQHEAANFPRTPPEKMSTYGSPNRYKFEQSVSKSIIDRCSRGNVKVNYNYTELIFTNLVLVSMQIVFLRFTKYHVLSLSILTILLG